MQSDPRHEGDVMKYMLTWSIPTDSYPAMCEAFLQFMATGKSTPEGLADLGVGTCLERSLGGISWKAAARPSPLGSQWSGYTDITATVVIEDDSSGTGLVQGFFRTE